MMMLKKNNNDVMVTIAITIGMCVASVLWISNVPPVTRKIVTIRNNNVSAETQKQFDIVTATLIGEAGGESDPDSMLAVLCVIRNRADTIYVYELARQCLLPGQFSMWNNNNSHEIKSKWRNHPKWEEAQNLVRTLIYYPEKFPADITEGAKHYHRIDISPYWTAKSLGGKNENAIVTLWIGNHVFLKGVDD